MSMRVLIADDNRDAAESLGVLLNLGGDEVLDLDMPVMNGFAGALALRAEVPDLLLVALSGYLDDENRGRAAAIGFDLCVTKGGEFADFRRQLDTLLQRRAGGHPGVEAAASERPALPISN